MHVHQGLESGRVWGVFREVLWCSDNFYLHNASPQLLDKDLVGFNEVEDSLPIESGLGL